MTEFWEGEGVGVWVLDGVEGWWSAPAPQAGEAGGSEATRFGAPIPIPIRWPLARGDRGYLQRILGTTAKVARYRNRLRRAAPCLGTATYCRRWPRGEFPPFQSARGTE